MLDMLWWTGRSPAPRWRPLLEWLGRGLLDGLLILVLITAVQVLLTVDLLWWTR